MTVRPNMRNREEVARAMQRYYPPLLRDAGVGGATAGGGSASSSMGTGGSAAGSGKAGTSSSMGVGGSSAGKAGTSSTVGAGGSSAGSTGLDNADKKAGEHGQRGRDNAREKQSR